MEFRKAERRNAKLRLGITGPAGSGKTYGALLVAFGLGGKIAMIDTENGSGDLYSALGDYDVCSLQAPFTVQKYLEAIKMAENAGYDVIIIDSLSHAWAGEGGLLDMQGKIADSGRKNSFAAWREVTPYHNKLVETILASKCHIIATMRSKMEYIQVENEHGKKEIRKVGLAPVQRDGMEYEFGTVFDLSVNHFVNVSKDRTSMFDGQMFKLSEDTGRVLKEWLESGIDYDAIRKRKKAIYDSYMEKYNDAEQVKDAMLRATGGKSSKDWTAEDMDKLEADLLQKTPPAKSQAKQLDTQDVQIEADFDAKDNVA